MSEWVEAMPDDDPVRAERRSEYRLNRALRACIRGSLEPIFIVNLSASGFRASLAGPLPEGSFELEIPLPGGDLTVLARAVWSQAADLGELTAAGFTFLEPPPAVRDRLQEFLRSEVASRQVHEAPDPDAI